MEQDLKYTLEQIRKHLVLLQDHFTSYPCANCIQDKHAIALEGYAEEGYPMTDNKEIKNALIKTWKLAQELKAEREL